MPAIRPRRSALYMPASNARAIVKARELDCDTVILDLEDAVAPEAKEQARDAAIEAANDGGFGGREVVIRVNGLDTEWGEADLRAMQRAGCDAVLLPKVSGGDDLRRARALIGSFVPALWAMIETPLAMLQLPEIVRTAPEAGLAGLVAGTNDLAKDMRCRPDELRTPLVPLLVDIVVAARAGGLVVLDGVCNEINDMAVFERECRQGLMLGFDGKTLIHPRQVSPANMAFTPDDAEIVWARKVVDAFSMPENQGKGAIRLDGKMVEMLHRDQAQATLRLAAMCRKDEAENLG